MFCNILVSIDGSAHADEALTQAIDLAEAHRARLTLITAVHPCPPWVYSPASAGAAAQLAADLEREAHEVMSAAVQRVPNDVPVTKIITPKPIRSALEKQIETGHYDLLVMGSRGRGAVKASLLGSVSHHALHHSTIPVLIVHARPQPAQEARPQPAQEAPTQPARQEPTQPPREASTQPARELSAR